MMTERFEDRLLRTLQAEFGGLPGPAVVATRGLRSSRRRWAVAGGLVAAATAVLGVSLVGAAGPAYAIEARADGAVVVRLRNTDPVVLREVGQRLRAYGLDVDLYRFEPQCLTLPQPPLPTTPSAGPPSNGVPSGTAAATPSGGAGEAGFEVLPFAQAGQNGVAFLLRPNLTHREGKLYIAVSSENNEGVAPLMAVSRVRSEIQLKRIC